MKLALAFMMQFLPLNFLFASLSPRYIFLCHGSFSPQRLHLSRCSVELLSPPLWGRTLSCSRPRGWWEGTSLQGCLHGFPGFPRPTFSHFLDDAFLFLQLIFLYLPKKWCMRGQFSGPCLSQKIFILHSHWDVSLAGTTLWVENHFLPDYWRHHTLASFVLFALSCVAYGTLVPQPGFEPRRSTVEAWSHTMGRQGTPHTLTF